MGMERVWFRGVIVNTRTRAMLERAEARLGYELTITQGSYSTGVGASAGTHDGGGAVDLAAWDHVRKVRVLRDLGFAAWYRDPSEGPWPAHIHAIAIGDPELHWTARSQVTAYYNGRNGLANNAKDTALYRPNPIPVWPVELGKLSMNRLVKQFEAKRPERTPAVEKIQRALNWRLGREDLLVDGICGPKTKEAYYAWERKIGAADVGGLPGLYGVIKLVEGFHHVID